MNLKDRLYQFFSIRLVQHLSFWSVFLLLALWRFMDMERERIANEIFFEITQLFVIVLFVYFNLRYLIPKYWNKGEYFNYIINIIFYEFLIISFLSISIRYYPDIHFQKVAGDNPSRLIVMNFFKTNIFVLSSSLFHFVKEWIKLKDENLKFTEKAQEQLEAEISILKAQVNPHFLFNTLNNIYSMSLYDSKKTPEMILKLSQLISYMLYECKDEEVNLEKEIQFIKNYIDLESVRVEDIASINLEIKGEDPGHKIPPLLFIPLIENAFKHGISTEQNSSEINIKLEVSNNKVDLKINNPIDESKNDNRKEQYGGLGIENVKKRLNLLFPKRYEFTISKTDNLYSTHLSLTLS